MAVDLSDMKLISAYWGAALSLLAVVAYFAPWIIEPRDGLGLHLLAMGWFVCIASITFLVNFIIMIKMIRRGHQGWKHFAIADGVILICFSIVFLSAQSGYMVTV